MARSKTPLVVAGSIVVFLGCYWSRELSKNPEFYKQATTKYGADGGDLIPVFNGITGLAHTALNIANNWVVKPIGDGLEWLNNKGQNLKTTTPGSTGDAISTHFSSTPVTVQVVKGYTLPARRGSEWDNGASCTFPTDHKYTVAKSELSTIDGRLHAKLDIHDVCPDMHGRQIVPVTIVSPTNKDKAVHQTHHEAPKRQQPSIARSTGRSLDA